MPPKRKPREWGHPEGLPLEEVDEDAIYEGVVTNVSPYGVFVDFGAVKDGLLRVDKRIGRGYRRGMEVKGLMVVSCEPEAGRVVLRPDPGMLPEPPPRRSRSQAGRRSQSADAAPRQRPPRARSRPRQRRDWGHLEATPLEDLCEGDVYEGVVTNVSTSGVFVDIGAARDARLNIPTKYGRRLRIGDVLADCTLEVIDLENQRMGATLPDPDEATRHLPPKERKPRAKATQEGGAKAKSRAQAKAKAQRTAEEGYTPIEDLMEGSQCDGIIANKNQYGLFVNIGCEKDARLRVPRSLLPKFKKGDEVYGMKIEVVDLEKKQITVSLDDPELSVDGDGEGDEEEEDDDEQPPVRVRPATAAKRAASAPAAAKLTAPAAAKASPKPKPKAKPKALQVKSEHPDGLPLARFRTGSAVNGTVTGIGLRGVRVDIGAVTDGLLQLPRSIMKQFQPEDEVFGMRVEGLDSTGERVRLSLSDPLLEEPDRAPPAARAAARAGAAQQEPGTTAKAKAAREATGSGREAKEKPKATPERKAKAAAAKAQSKASAKAKAAAEGRWEHPHASSLDELEVGMEVSGTVTNVGQFGVFVDIGAVKDGKLRLARQYWRTYKVGDCIDSLLVEEVDPVAQSLWLRPTDMGEEDELEEAEEEAAPARPPVARRKAPAAKAGQAPAPKQAATKPRAAAPAAGTARKRATAGT